MCQVTIAGLGSGHPRRGQRGGRDRVRRRGQVQGFTPPAKPICRLADRGLDLEGDRQRMPPARDVRRDRGAWRVVMANRCVSMYAYDGLARCYRRRGQRERTGQPKLISDAGERPAEFTSRSPSLRGSDAPCQCSLS